MVINGQSETHVVDILVNFLLPFTFHLYHLLLCCREHAALFVHVLQRNNCWSQQFNTKQRNNTESNTYTVPVIQKLAILQTISFPVVTVTKYKCCYKNRREESVHFSMRWSRNLFKNGCHGRWIEVSDARSAEDKKIIRK